MNARNKILKAFKDKFENIFKEHFPDVEFYCDKRETTRRWYYILKKWVIIITASYKNRRCSNYITLGLTLKEALNKIKSLTKKDIFGDND